MLGPHMSKLLMTLKIVTGQKVMTMKCFRGVTLDPSLTVGSKYLTAGSIRGRRERNQGWGKEKESVFGGLREFISRESKT